MSMAHSKKKRQLPKILKINDEVFVRSYTHSNFNEELEAELKEILSGAGITPKDNELYLTPSAAKWAGKHFIAVEVRRDYMAEAGKGSMTYMVHSPGHANAGKTIAYSKDDAIRLLEVAKASIGKVSRGS